MKGFDSIRAKSAVKAREPEDLSRSHQTTMDFGQIGVLMNEKLCPVISLISRHRISLVWLRL